MNRSGKLALIAAVILLLAMPAVAQQQSNQQTNANPLVQLLQSKGILTAQEAATINQASSAGEANIRLAQLLESKGLISKEELQKTVAAEQSSSDAHLVNAVVHVPSRAPDRAAATSDPYTFGPPADAGVIPAVAPVRVLPIDIPKQGGLIPDIKLGSGANLKLYGFFKVSAVENTASSGSAQNGVQDFPLPLLLGDTGPKGDPYFLIKARSFRIGSQYEWVPKGSDMVLTAKIEADYEGDYTTVNNRSISSVRSSQLSLRLAYVRLDTKLGDTPVFMEFGQDWTLNSTTLPNIYETTGLMVGYGAFYERAPMFKTGVQFHTGDVKIQPEFAIVLPVSSDANLTQLQRTGFGDRAGAESNEPGVEARIVFQFPLMKDWKGVAPAQVIFSGHHSSNNEIITAGASASVPTSITANGGSSGLPNTLVTGATGCSVALPTGGCSIKGFYPTGVQVDDPINALTAEVQLPTPWVTFDAKYYNGDNLRWFFAGQLNTVFPSIGLSPTNAVALAGSATSFSGQSINFGCPSGAALIPATTCNGPITVGTLEPIKGQGGFAEMSFPLSRIFHADPEGHNAGWVFHLLYGTDRAKAEDARRGNGLVRSDYDSASLTYKLNKWVSFVNEVTYMDTRAATHDAKTFRGIPATQAHAWRQEFGTVFTF